MPDSSPYCFISYSRRDTDLARWLQHQLESYKYPAALVRPGLRPSDPARLRPVFLDTSDLPTSSGKFWDDISAKIDSSRYLLVLCSRASAASEYVDREIARFIGQDEGRLDNIILAIVDPKITLSSPIPEDFPPQIFRRWKRLSSRNHPLILPKEGESTSAVRRRGLMQIISFMLGIQWTVLYNRHLIARRKVLLRIASLVVVILTGLSVSLAWALWKESELTTFERRVFPYSLVVGYVDNFLSPLITTLETEPAKPIIIIAMPDSYEELDHNRRVANYRDRIVEAGYKLELKKVKTTLPRGAETGIIVPTPPYYKDKHMEVYIDFASTVAAFRHVIEYKKRNIAYARSSENIMVLEYAAEFEKSVKEQLQRNDKHKDQRDRIIFVRSPAAALRILAGEIKFQKGAEFVLR
jgi:TIR domain